MSQITCVSRTIALVLLCVSLAPGALRAQTTEITTEYLMTVYAPLNEAQVIDESMAIVGVRDGGWVRGPEIEGTVRSPGGDWLQTLPDGTRRLDVRATIETDDGAFVYISYNGIARGTDESEAKLEQGEIVTSDEYYIVTAPTMRTASETYSWLNHVQCVGKMTRLKRGEDAFIEYDVFIVR